VKLASSQPSRLGKLSWHFKLEQKGFFQRMSFGFQNPRQKTVWLAFVSLLLLQATVLAQSVKLTGRVVIAGQDTPVHNAIVVIVQLKRTAQTDEQGRYEFKDVPAGTYTLIAQLDRLPDATQRVTVNGDTTADLAIKLTGIRDQVTVSAAGSAQTALEAFQGATGLDSTTLLENNPQSLGESLEKQVGITKRSSGPGASRPVIRGFDGDRVLIAQDGIRSGSVSYSSADHGEPINVLTVKRLEVVRGPATLLYGSSALGGIINAVTDHEQAHAGLNGFFSSTAAATLNLGGASAGLEYGTQRWMVWANGGGQTSGDYRTPLGRILNSGTRAFDFNGGGGYYGQQVFFNASYFVNRNRFGVPFDPTEEEPEVVALDPRRQSLRLNGGFNELSGALDHVHLTFDYTNYRHDELIGNVPETRFFNKTWSYRAIAEQKRTGKLTGTIGMNGFYRDYQVQGDEALVPPTTQSSFAVFGVEQLDFGKVAFQFGGRLEHNEYHTVPDEVRQNRAFTGFSGSFGVRVPVWEGGAASANYSHTYRAPSLDELYNQGPHPGNLTFEIGNTALKRERGDGLDLSFRQSYKNLRAEAHYFYYRLQDYIFLAPTGDEDDGLPVAEYQQGNARYTGAEVDVNAGLNQYLAVNFGLDLVNASLTEGAKLSLPRIPPLRARLGFDLNYRGFRVFPELISSRNQDQVFSNETTTAGWATVNVLAGYSRATAHAAHIISVNGFNLNNKLYRNHLSFLKAIAPEVGRGVRVTYTVRFF
jgi:iron complex outermembrane recepter protein